MLCTQLCTTINEQNEFGQLYLKKVFLIFLATSILLPGGAVSFSDSDFAKAGRFLYKLAVDANDKGNYFPIWGTCLGFEFLLYTAAGSQEIRADCGAWNVVNRLKFTDSKSFITHMFLFIRILYFV